MKLSGKDPAPDALREFRERRGWTHEQMADAVGASPLEVAAWEAGSVRVPRTQARWIRGLAEQDQRYAAVIEAELDPCAWADANAHGLHEHLCLRPWDTEPLAPGVVWHLGECAVCGRARTFGRSLRDAPEPGLGSDPVESGFNWLLRGSPVRLFAAFAVLWLLLDPLGSWMFRRLSSDPEDGWFWQMRLPVAMGLLGFYLAGRALGDWRRRWPYLAGLLRGLATALGGVLGWMVNDRSREVGPGVLMAALAVALVVGGMAGRWMQLHSPEDDEDDDEALADAGAAPPLGEPAMEGGLDSRQPSREHVPAAAPPSTSSAS